MSLNAEAAEALRNGAALIRARGFSSGHCWIPAVGVQLGARADYGPVCMVSALADVKGGVFRRAYTALLAAARCHSLSAWEHGRSRDEVLAVFERAWILCRRAAEREALPAVDA